MRVMPYRLEGKGVVQLTAVSSPELWKKKGGGAEPTSVLDTRRSPSPPTSTSTLSCGGGGCGGGGGGDSAGVAAVSDSHRSKWQEEGLFGGGEGRREEWPPDLHPIPASLEGMATDKCGLVGLDDCWDDMLAGPPPSPPCCASAAGQELPFYRWFAADTDEQLKPLVPDASAAASASFALVVDPAAFGFEPPPPAVDFPPLHCTTAAAAARLISPPSMKTQAPTSSFSTPLANYTVPVPPNVYYNQSSGAVDEKPAMVGGLTPQLSINQHQSHPTQNQSFFLPLPLGQPEPPHILLPPNPKRHHVLEQHAPTPLYTSDPFSRKQPAPPPQPHVFSSNPQHQFGRKGEDGVQQAAAEQLGRAAEMVEAGNSVNARGILARLNHQLSTPAGKHPLLRAAFYFKEALQLLLDPNNSGAASPLAVVFKISAYKAFSELSPVLQFANFTSDQALLEATAGFHRLHVIDFDIALGGQWASFMKELAVRAGGTAPSLKITAVVSADADVLELRLTRENLAHFAAELGIPFDFRVDTLVSFEASTAALAGEVVVVNLPVSLPSGRPAAGLLRLVKQLNPNLVVSLDRGAEQTELPFAGFFAASLRSHAVLLDSLDAVNVSSDAVQKIERFLVGPRIEKLLAGRHCSGAGDRQLQWRSLFAAAGLSPVPFSSFTETQAECLVKRLQIKGFHVEKKHSSLCLCWQMGELVSVSAWRF